MIFWRNPSINYPDPVDVLTETNSNTSILTLFLHSEARRPVNTIKLSSKGQVIIPKPLRTAHHWEVGQELVVVDLGDGILLKPKTPFDETDIADVASCLKYEGKPKSIDDMTAAIKQGIKDKHQ